MKSEAKASLFRYQKAKAALARVVTDEEHDWLRVALLLRDSTLYWLVRRGSQNRIKYGFANVFFHD